MKSSQGLDLQRSGNLNRSTPSSSDDDLKREESVTLGNIATMRNVRKHSVNEGMSDNDSDFMDAKEFVLNTEMENDETKRRFYECELRAKDSKPSAILTVCK